MGLGQTGVAVLVDRFLSSTRQMEAEEAAALEQQRRVVVSNTLARDNVTYIISYHI